MRTRAPITRARRQVALERADRFLDVAGLGIQVCDLAQGMRSAIPRSLHPIQFLQGALQVALASQDTHVLLGPG